MKAPIATLTMALTTSTAAFAQTPIEINDLRTPASPAFTLLDVTPASVERPESPKAVVLNLLSTVSQSEGLPKDYALQVTPYWLKAHPLLEFADYQSPSVGMSLLRTFAVSVATAPLLDASVPETKTIGTRIGLGFRSTIVGGRENPNMAEKLRELEAINKQILDHDDPDLRSQARAIALDIQKLERTGLFVTAAAGQVWTVPQDDLAQRTRDRWGAWLTPSYRMLACGGAPTSCKSIIDVIGVVRVLREPDEDTRWDLGARLLWQPTEPFNISAEFLRRRGQEGNDQSSDRTVGIVEYRIREDLLLFGSFGKDFKDDKSRRTLVSLLGLSFGFGTKPVATVGVR